MNTKKLMSLVTALLLAAILCAQAGVAFAQEESVELVVFAAASMTETLNQIKETYEAENPGVTLTYRNPNGRIEDVRLGGDWLPEARSPSDVSVRQSQLLRRRPGGIRLRVLDHPCRNQDANYVPEGGRG